MTVKEHYDKHLGNFYSWMLGDFESKQKDFQEFLTIRGIKPSGTKIAIDLGAGHGIQSIALKNLGYNVKAIDFNKQLLNELQSNANGSSIEIIEDDIRQIKKYGKLKPELILCCGDTITHLENHAEIENLIRDSSNCLAEKGKLVLSFRDYSNELIGDHRFIPVKSDDERIVTCFLEYKSDKVNVTDLLYEKTENGWIQKISSYCKVRIRPSEIIQMIENNGMKVTFNESLNRMQTIIAER